MSEAPFSLREQSRTSVTLSVIAPCLNEQDNVDLLVQRILAIFELLPCAAELVLVDDGSADETWEGMRRLAAGDSRVQISQHLSNQGMVRAWQTGLATARGMFVCLIDADLQNRPEDIPALYRRMSQGDTDLVQGVRLFANPPWIRLVISRGLNILLNVAFNMRSRDNKSGFVLCRRDVLHRILRHRYRYRYFQSFIGPSAKIHGYRISEVETVHEPRRSGTSFLPRVPVGVIIRLAWETLRFRVETWIHAPEGRSAKAPAAMPLTHNA